MKNRSSCIIALVLFAYAPTAVFASAGGGIEIPGVGTFAINFLLFVAFVTYLTKDKITTAWVARAEKIESEVTKNERARLKAQEELDSAVKEKQRLPETVAAIASSIEKEQKEECERIRSEGEALAQKAGKRLHDIVAQEVRAANATFEKKLADAVIEQASKKLNASWSAAKDEEFSRAHILSSGSLNALMTGARNG